MTGRSAKTEWCEAEIATRVRRLVFVFAAQCLTPPAAWFSITSVRWKTVAAAFDIWMSPDNFDAKGHQKQQLSELTLAT